MAEEIPEESQQELVANAISNDAFNSKTISDNSKFDVQSILTDVGDPNMSKEQIQSKYTTEPGKTIAKALLDQRETGMQLAGKNAGFNMSSGTQGMLDETTSVGKSNASKLGDYCKKKISELLEFISPKDSPEDIENKMNDPKNQSEIDKAKTKVQDQITKNKGTWKENAWKALFLLLSSLSGIISLLKGAGILQALKDLAKGMSSCNEVNYTLHSDKKLSCSDDGKNTLKNACSCVNPDSLKGICTDYNPSNKCDSGGYSYIFKQVQWYDLFSLLLAGISQISHMAGDFFSGIYSWISDHKYIVIGSIVALLLILIIYNLISS